jgi:hypothetical protein
MSHEIDKNAGAEAVKKVEGNMCGTAMRGAVALPGSKNTSRAKGIHRKLGDRAARLAAISAGESPANRGVQSLL